MSQSSLSIFSRICRRAFALYWLLRTFSSEEPAFTATSSLAVSREYLIRNSCETNAYKWSDRPEETNCASALKSHAVKVVCVTSWKFRLPAAGASGVSNSPLMNLLIWFTDDRETILGFTFKCSDMRSTSGTTHGCAAAITPLNMLTLKGKTPVFGTPQRSESSHQ